MHTLTNKRGRLINPVLFALGLAALVFTFPSLARSATGVMEVYSTPSGARIFVEDKFVGKTPYQNVDMPVGQYTVRAVLNDDYPPQTALVQISEVAPQIVRFYFESGRPGEFTGNEIQRTVEKYTGNVQFASIPSGALVYVNGDELKPTPIGYRDIEVGTYDVEFRHEGKFISGRFNVVRDDTVKIVGNFKSMQVEMTCARPVRYYQCANVGLSWLMQSRGDVFSESEYELRDCVTDNVMVNSSSGQYVQNEICTVYLRGRPLKYLDGAQVFVCRGPGTLARESSFCQESVGTKQFFREPRP